MIYVILGQTASGKTSLALKLAREYHLPIISADAYQCYKMMQIGTDKPTEEMTEGIEYYFYDEYAPDVDMDVSTFQKKMRPILEKYLDQGKDILVVGGTFLYIKALLFNYVFSQKENVSSIYRSMDLETLQKTLEEKNGEIYHLIDNKNPRRLIRALEQIDEGKDRKKILQENDNVPLYPTTFLAIDIDKEEGNSKIDKRIDDMFQKGIVDEVKRLLSLYPRTCHSFLAIGYKEIIQGLDEGKSQEEMKELIKIHTHQYAKKQRTFLNHQFDNIYRGTKEEIEQRIRTDIGFFQRTKILLKPKVLNKIRMESCYFVGLGGVGGSAILSLLRLGIKDFVIQDGDIVDVSNLNRQFLYTAKDISRNKAEVAKERLLEINPLFQVEEIDKQIETEDDMTKRKCSLIIDCIDDCNAKVLLYEKSTRDKSLYLTSMGAGFHIDSTKLRLGSLKDAFDPLSKRFKKALVEKGHSEEEFASIKVVYVTDAAIKGQKNSKLIGSISMVPNAAGLALATYYLRTRREETTTDKGE